jgi:integrase
MREGDWSPANKKSNAYELEHYLCSHFGTLPLRNLDAFEIQIWLNKLAAKGYSEAVVSHCFTNIRAITRLAKKQKFLSEDPAEDVTKPQTKSIKKPVMTTEQIRLLLKAINDIHDLCLLYVGIFCGTRTSEVMGMQWKSWNGESLTPYGTAFEGKRSVGRLKTKQSKAPIPVPQLVRPILESWRQHCAD